MAKDVPHAGVFEIAKLNSLKSPTRFKKHHYQLAWEGKHLEYNQRFGRGAYRERLDLSTIFSVMLADEPGRRGAGQHIALTTRGVRSVRYKIRIPEDDFHEFLYWLLVSLSKHRGRGAVAGISQARGGLRKKSRQQKLGARQDYGDYAVDHDQFLNALALFEEQRSEGKDLGGALQQFGSRVPQPVEVSIFTRDDARRTPPPGVIEGEGGTIIKTLGDTIGSAHAAGVVKVAERLVNDLQRTGLRLTQRTEPCVVKYVSTIAGDTISQHAKDTIVEGQVLAALGKHDNIVEVIDVRMARNTVILILEKGSYDLASRARALGRNVTPEAIRTITQDMLCGLAYMHARRIYHLDIKPENVLLFDKEGTDRAKLIDFGKSKTKQLHRGDMYGEPWPKYGTKYYIAPESYDIGQMPSRGEHLAKRDAFAIGIVIFRSLLAPRYGWPTLDNDDVFEAKDVIVARAKHWQDKVQSRAGLDLLMADGLHDISSMATALVEPVRDHRITVEDAYKVVEPKKKKKKKTKRPTRSLL